MLLEQYWRARGGRLYLEVPIGGPGGSGEWLPGCTVRRIDAVRFSSRSRPDAIGKHAESKIAFDADLQALAAELIEVKASLNRAAIGQAIAGGHIFRRQYAVTPSRTIILCRTSDSGLGWVCQQEDIGVEVIAQTPS